jgi:hypothetical protein
MKPLARGRFGVSRTQTISRVRKLNKMCKQPVQPFRKHVHHRLGIVTWGAPWDRPAHSALPSEQPRRHGTLRELTLYTCSRTSPCWGMNNPG